MKNVVLIGMPGCGKSTIGVVLAKVLGYHFEDCDLVIQHQTGKLLCEIIEANGAEGFLKIENEILSGINCERTIIATGGSAVYGSEAMAHLKENGTVVYLKLTLDEINRRLGDYSHRGVVLKNGQSFEEAYIERCALYERYADIVVDCNGLDVRQTIDLVEGYLR